jgi:hypothetical protein
MQYLVFWALRFKTQIPRRNCENLQCQPGFHLSLERKGGAILIHLCESNWFPPKTLS